MRFPARDKASAGILPLLLEPFLPTTREISFHSCVQPPLGGFRAPGVKKETASRIWRKSTDASLHRDQLLARLERAVFWTANSQSADF
jgi:hypothetical protein